MKKICQVTVAVLVFNTDVKKILRTIYAIINQKQINIEIIINDDGSDNFNRKEIEDTFFNNNFENYKILTNSKNQGTVKSCTNVLRHAQGEFIFFTSGGDYLYDEFTLRDFYEYAKKNNQLVCFGNAIFYSYNKGEIKIYNEPSRPARRQLYFKEYDFFNQKVEFFYEDMILGASYFREINFAKKYFQKIEDYAKYVEDGTSTLFALLDGIRIGYYDRNMIWYEFGNGVSTGGNARWTNLLNKDYEQIFKKLKKDYPHDPLVDAGYMKKFKNKTMLDRIMRIIKHPYITFVHLKNKRLPVVFSPETEYDSKIIESICKSVK